MRKFLTGVLLAACMMAASCSKSEPSDPVVPVEPVDPVPVVPERTGESRISYQILVYSFADSDGDGVGDFTGIRDRLDYLKEMGVQALWLSPIHPATSYHGYDVEDYTTVNPAYGTEQDFKVLLDAAHSKGIKIYIDYVLNHTSKEHPWFKEGKSDPSSIYRDYYHFSTTKKSGWSSTVCGENPGKVKVRFTLACNSSGVPQTLTAEQVDTVANTGEKGSGKYLWYGSVSESTMPEFYSQDDGTFSLSLELETEWGVLIRTSRTEWGSKKFGAVSSENNVLSWGKPLSLKASSDYDILMPWMGSIWYQSVFGSYMPDINYGPASTCETSGAFTDLGDAACKWIEMGVDGFRLDAVKHIYDDADSDENPLFLKKFYDRCNSAYKAQGHTDDIYMVGEQWSEPDLVAPYYKGLNAFFEFAFWWRLTEAVGKADGSSFASTIASYHTSYSSVRTDAIAATKLTNHDEDRAASTLGRDRTKLALAAAVLLTSGGEPYIYQGEELGYWGQKTNGDIYVRTPVLWTGDISSAATAGVQEQYDKSMLVPSMSVESQAADSGSLLNVYRKFGVLRDRYKALALGSMTPKTVQNASASAWYRERDGQKILVVHNFSASRQSISLTGDNLGNLICSNGTVEVSGSSVVLGGYTSAIFLQ